MKAVKFRISKTSHLVLDLLINGLPGVFLLDTGASHNCVSEQRVTHFNMFVTASRDTFSGIGGIQNIQYSNNNVMQLGKFTDTEFSVVVLGLDHVNESFSINEEKHIDGILGSDFLIKNRAVIDYEQQVLILN